MAILLFNRMQLKTLLC